MVDDTLLNKAQIIEKCLKRIDEVYENCPDNLRNNFTKQDSIILNLERACEACIDIAMRLVRKYKLGIPQESREAFDLLVQAGKIETSLADKLKSMIGFRNIAVHDYQKLNLDIVANILKSELKFLNDAAKLAIQESKQT